MAEKNIAVLKTYFETGDRPTEGQFADLIDSFVHKNTGAAIVSKSYDETTGDFSIGFSDNTTISFNVPLSVGISFVEGLQDALDNKVDKVTGKGLSSNDYTNIEKEKVAENAVHRNTPEIHVSASDRENWDNKVDQEEGKGLSSNDYTDTEKAQVATNKLHVEDDTTHVNPTKDFIWSDKIKNWTANENFPVNIPYYRIYKNAVYLLTIANNEYPFDTTDIDAEIINSKWSLVLKGKNTIFVFGNEFELKKNPINNNPLSFNTLENNDFIVNGFRDNNTIWEVAQCLDSLNTNIDASWNVIRLIENITNT